MKTKKTKGRKARAKKAPKGKRIGVIHASADQGWPAGMGTMYKPIKKPVTLRLDADIIAWFKAQGRGYQTRINRALREVMSKNRRRG
jgi:uncharacterized protein (DUF4415 family)